VIKFQIKFFGYDYAAGYNTVILDNSLFTDSDDTRGCIDTLRPPEDEQGNARNMWRILIKVLYVSK
jgi:hypothetical protein